MNSETIVRSRAKLQQMLNGYQASCIMVAAGELDVFAPILRNENSLSVAGICEALNSNPRTTETLMDALCALGILKKTIPQGMYSVPDEFKELLDINHPLTFIPMLRHAGTCMRQWIQLAWTVKSGVPAPRCTSILGPQTDMKSFILAMNSIAVELAPLLVRDMKDAGLLNFQRLLDVGAGPGTYTIEMLKVMPNATAMLFDLPVGIQTAKNRVKEENLEDRITFFEGDFYVDELPQGADFVWLSAIIHQHDREKSRNLYAKINRALPTGGKLAIRDALLEPDRTAPVFGTMFAMNMAANTESGMVYTYDEIKEDLEKSGFTDVKLAIATETMNSVVTAIKL